MKPSRAFRLIAAAGAALLACSPGSDTPDARDTAAQAGVAESGLAAADSLVAAWVASERIPGAVLSVTLDGRTVLESAHGWAERYGYGQGQYGAWRDGTGQGGTAQESAPRTGALERLADPRPMTTATVFDLASVTKVMATTFGVMMLVDDGAVSLDAPVRSYLPDFTDGGKDGITVRHLLSHTAGLLQWVPTYYHARTADQAYAYVRDLPLAWPVGEGRHYSDLGFMLLGRIVETVSGQPLDAFVQTRLYGPLGLTDTGFRRATGTPAVAPPRVGTGAATAPASRIAATSHGNPFEYRMVHDSTFGYRIAGNADAWNGWRRHTLVGEVNDGNAWHAFGGVAGHAGLFSTAADLQVLLGALMNRGAPDDDRMVAAEVVTTFLTEQVDGQALGWQVPDYAPAGSFTHTGFTGTWVLGVPETGLAVVLLTNRQNGGVDGDDQYPDIGPLQRAVAAALLGSGR